MRVLLLTLFVLCLSQVTLSTYSRSRSRLSTYSTNRASVSLMHSVPSKVAPSQTKTVGDQLRYLTKLVSELEFLQKKTMPIHFLPYWNANFSQYDLDKSGSLSYSEFTSLINKLTWNLDAGSNEVAGILFSVYSVNDRITKPDLVNKASFAVFGYVISVLSSEIKQGIQNLVPLTDEANYIGVKNLLRSHSQPDMFEKIVSTFYSDLNETEGKTLSRNQVLQGLNSYIARWHLPALKEDQIKQIAPPSTQSFSSYHVRELLKKIISL